MMDISSSCCLKSLETGINKGVEGPSPEPLIQDVTPWPAEQSVSWEQQQVKVCPLSCVTSDDFSFRGDSALLRPSIYDTCESDCPDLNPNTTPYYLCNLGQVTSSLLTRKEKIIICTCLILHDDRM